MIILPGVNFKNKVCPEPLSRIEVARKLNAKEKAEIKYYHRRSFSGSGPSRDLAEVHSDYFIKIFNHFNHLLLKQKNPTIILIFILCLGVLSYMKCWRAKCYILGMETLRPLRLQPFKRSNFHWEANYLRVSFFALFLS